MSRVVVVGDGIIGLCAAHALSVRGHSVTVVGKAGLSGAASSGNGGMIVPSHFVPLAAPGMVGLGLRLLPNPKGPFGFALPPSGSFLSWSMRFMRAANEAHVKRAAPLILEMNLRSRARYAELAEQSEGAFGFTPKGLIMLCAEAATFAHEQALAATAQQLGLKVEVLDPAALADRDPGISLSVAGGVHFLDDAHFDVGRFLAWFESGPLAPVKHMSSREVSWVREGMRLRAVRTDAGEIEADEFVLATGAWTEDIGRTLGLKLPMMAGKGYGFSLADPPETPSICAILTEARVAVTPMVGHLRFVGTMEIGRPDSRMNVKRVQGILESIPRYYPRFAGIGFEGPDGLRIGRDEVWVGLRPVTPDGLPYLGRPASIPNLVVAAGHGMMGMSLGPATGDFVADLVEARPLDLPNVAMLDVDRFG